MGKAAKGQQPVQEEGIRLHAATGTVVVQAQNNRLEATAKQQVAIDSTHGSVSSGARGHQLLVAAGSAIEMKDGNITLLTKGSVTFKISQKVLTGPLAAKLPPLKFPAGLSISQEATLRFILTSLPEEGGIAYAGMPYKLYVDGALVKKGITDEDGEIIAKIKQTDPKQYKVELANGLIYELDVQKSPPSDKTQYKHMALQLHGWNEYKNESGADDVRSLEKQYLTFQAQDHLKGLS